MVYLICEKLSLKLNEGHWSDRNSLCDNGERSSSTRCSLLAPQGPVTARRLPAVEQSGPRGSKVQAWSGVCPQLAHPQPGPGSQGSQD